MHPLLRALLRTTGRRAFRRFEQDCANLRAVQEETLRGLVARLGCTRAARRLGFDKVRSLDELQRALPLTTYESYAPEIDGMMKGEPDAMVPGQPELLGLTAGTSGQHKYIPLTPAFRADFQAPMSLFVYGLLRDHPAMLNEGILYFVGPAVMDHAPGGTPIGMISGYNYQRMPRLLASGYVCPYAPFGIADATTRSYAVALCALAREVSFAVAITTSPLAHLGKTMREHADRLLRDLAEGTFTPPAPVKDAERASLQPYLRALPRRARELAARAGRHGALVPASAWPSLAVLSCWFHSGAGANAAELPELYGKLPWRSAIYSATEGWINVPLQDRDPWGPIAPRSNVYEFIPVDERGQRCGDPVLADGVEEGRSYVLVLTSGAGLFRYVLGDIVQCAGFFHRSPLISFVRKEGNACSVARDLTNEAQVRAAVELLRAQGCGVGRYCFAPVAGDPAHYALAVAAGAGLEAAALSAAFDEALAQVNTWYRGCRRDGALGPAEVMVLASERFERFDRARSTGAAGAQVKPVEFSAVPGFLAPLLTERSKEGAA